MEALEQAGGGGGAGAFGRPGQGSGGEQSAVLAYRTLGLSDDATYDEVTEAAETLAEVCGKRPPQDTAPRGASPPLLL